MSSGQTPATPLFLACGFLCVSIVLFLKKPVSSISVKAERLIGGKADTTTTWKPSSSFSSRHLDFPLSARNQRARGAPLSLPPIIIISSPCGPSESSPPRLSHSIAAPTAWHTMVDEIPSAHRESARVPHRAEDSPPHSSTPPPPLSPPQPANPPHRPPRAAALSSSTPTSSARRVSISPRLATFMRTRHPDTRGCPAAGRRHPPGPTRMSYARAGQQQQQQQQQRRLAAGGPRRCSAWRRAFAG
jgi:hypothetical protein